MQVTANTRATAAAVGERTRSAAAVASQQVPANPLAMLYCCERTLQHGRSSGHVREATVKTHVLYRTAQHTSATKTCLQHVMMIAFGADE